MHLITVRGEVLMQIVPDEPVGASDQSAFRHVGSILDLEEEAGFSTAWSGYRHGCSRETGATEYPSAIPEDLVESRPDEGERDMPVPVSRQTDARDASSGEDAPRVLAVVAVSGPDAPFDETLVSLARQRYPNLAVVVVDLCEDRHIDASVKELVPAAKVFRPASHNAGFGAAMNRAADLGIETTYYLFCHDDVFFEPDAVAEMVGEAARSRAAVVGPKFVYWDDPTRIQHVGVSCDKFAVTGELAGADEFDQGQRDAVADVLVTPGGAQLVHSGLFEAIGGFDESMILIGEDVDLCWRAQLAGARVVVCPDAHVRHVEDVSERVDGDIDRLRRRHELRTVMANYSVLSLVLILPQLLVITLASAVVSTVTRRFSHASAALSAWTWNLRRISSVRKRRATLKSVRQIPDRELRHLQQRGSIRASRFLHSIVDTDEGMIAQSRSAMAATMQEQSMRSSMIAGAVFIALFLFGSRHLLSGIPVVGEFAAFPEGIEGFIVQWWGGWRPVSMGDSGAAPIGLAFLGGANMAFLGADGLVRLISILGLIPLGVFGAWRLLRPTTSTRARVVCAVVYAANPVVFNAVAKAQWSPLIVYAAAPYVFAGFARLLGATPFGDRGGPAGPSGNWPLLRIVVASGLIAGLVVAYAPIALVGFGVIVAGLLVGSICAGHPARLFRLVFGSIAVIAIAMALNTPMLIDLASDGGTWATIGVAQDAAPGDLSLVDMLHFDTGPLDVGWLGWAILVPSGLALLFSRGWRLAWAVRGWFVALGAWGIAWVDEWGAIPVAVGQTDMLLVVAGLGLGVAAAMGAISVEADILGRSRTWRRFLPALGIAALVIWTLPVIGASFEGRWLMPRRDLAVPLSVLDATEPGGYRVLWIGDPDVLGLRGYRLDGTLAYATSDDGQPNISNRWIDEPSRGMQDLGQEIRIALAGQENRLGARLADYGIRFVVVVERLGERPFGEVERPVDPAVLASMGEQLDLRRIEGVNGAVTIFESAVDTSTRRSVPDGENEDTVLQSHGVPTLLERTGPSTFEGIVPGEQDLVAAYNAETGWDLEVSESRVDRVIHNEWANEFPVQTGGDGALRFEAASSEKLARVAQLIGWLVLAMLAMRLATAGAFGRREES